MAGSNLVHLQAVDNWSNNITQGGEAFVARWTPREAATAAVSSTYSIADSTDDGDGDKIVAAAVEEGDFWENDDGYTASIAAGFFFPVSSDADTNTTNTTGTVDDGSGNSSSTVSPGGGGDTGAYVADVGGGRYEITTAPATGSYWLEIGVVEPGGLWGTYYEDGAAETEGRWGGGHRKCWACLLASAETFRMW